MEQHGTEEGRTKVMKTLVPSKVFKKALRTFIKKKKKKQLAFQKAFMLHHRLTNSCNNKDMTHDMIQPNNIF